MLRVIAVLLVIAAGVIALRWADSPDPGTPTAPRLSTPAMAAHVWRTEGAAGFFAGCLACSFDALL